ncbi:MAG TPA: MJ0042-type zinc finger domain-containing protein [Candidatus Limnocylindrales bacterium]|nr:MJ0042-type zinc finger domain-containing protein [Candidatus Limnocylindrales bacterium]
MTINCPSCNASQVIKASEADQKKAIRCSQCGTLFKPDQETKNHFELDMDLDALLIPPENSTSESVEKVESKDRREPKTENIPSLDQLNFELTQPQETLVDLNLGPLTLEENKSSPSKDEEISSTQPLEGPDKDVPLTTQTMEMTTKTYMDRSEDETPRISSGEELDLRKTSLDPVAKEPPLMKDTPDTGTARRQPLTLCCIQSLKLGRDTCYICGRRLDPQDPEVEKELKKIQVQPLRDKTKVSTHAVTPSKEPGKTLIQEPGKTIRNPSVPGSITEDFSDLEKALDALTEKGPGSDLQKKLAKRKNILVQGLMVLVGLLGLGVLAKVILPSNHEKLLKQYSQLIAQEEPGPEEIVHLGLAAAKYEDHEILKLIATTPNFPKIEEGKLLQIDNPYDQQNLGSLIQRKAELQQTIRSIEEQLNLKAAQIKQYESNKVPSKILKDSLEKARADLRDLLLEFESKKKESLAKVAAFQEKGKALREDLAKAIQIQRENIDRTDPFGKSLYTTNVQKEKKLLDQISRNEDDLKAAQIEQQKYINNLENQYNPQIEELRKKIAELEQQYELATDLEDPTRSPVERLKAEMAQLNVDLPSMKKQLEEVEKIFKDLPLYFKNPAHLQDLSTNPKCIFSSVKRNAFVELQEKNNPNEKRTWVLKKYEAQCQDKLFKSPWLVSELK